MLQTLTIRDLALIEEAEVSFTDGFNVISGETGGGKSLVIAALKLLRGEKGRGDRVRHGAKELRVDAEFVLGEGERSLGVAEAVQELCGVELEDELLIVTRIVDSKGRSRARVNGRPITLAALRELGGWLLEIHGQGDSRALMRPEIQCETLDNFAGTRGLREDFALALDEARACRERRDAVLGSEAERQSRCEFLRYQIQELEALDLRQGELAELEKEHRILAHLDRMRELLSEALGKLSEGEPAVIDLLGQAERAVGEASRIDEALGDAAGMLQEAEVSVQEAGRVLQSHFAALDLDPARLAAVEERLAELRRALQRFGPGEEQFLARLAGMQDELAQLTDGTHSPEALEQELQDKLAAAMALGQKLIKARKKAATRFTKAVEVELAQLGMERTKLRVDMGEKLSAETFLDSATRHGPGPVDFVVRINPGEPELSMRESASGGEMARIVLAIKKCLADQDRVPFLVFDEVDAEIGGRLGFQVGGKLRAVAQHHQLLIVTHLPQVAAFAEAHFKVEKQVQKSRTVTGVRRLDARDVERELAAMSGSVGADRESLEEARRMLQRVQGELEAGG